MEGFEAESLKGRRKLVVEPEINKRIYRLLRMKVKYVVNLVVLQVLQHQLPRNLFQVPALKLLKPFHL
jgi:hypothetical protein